MRALPTTGLRGRYWGMTDGGAVKFFIATSAAVWVIAACAAWVSGAGWLSLIVGFLAVAAVNIAFSIYNILHI